MAGPEPRPPADSPRKIRPRRRRRWRALLALSAALFVAVGTWHAHKPLPAGVHVDGPFVATSADALQFLADVTARDASGQPLRRQQIHAATLELVRGARDFLVLDYFLFNDQGGPAGPLDYGTGLAPVSLQLIEAVRALKTAQPALPVLILVDPINDYYRGTALPALASLAPLGVDIVVTNLDMLRDPNPVYSAPWRVLFSWWLPTRGEGSVSNLLDAEGPALRLGALLRLPNFKANHRKVAITGDGNGSLVGIVSSANPHDASSAHSNVALRITSEALRPLLESELDIAKSSGWKGGPLLQVLQAQERASPADATHVRTQPDQALPDDVTHVEVPPSAPARDTRVAIVTEGAIRDALLDRLAATQRGDAVDIAQFYLAERRVIRALLAAARRGVRVRVLLDPNRDAFGFEKSGIPNRPVGSELLRRSDGAIALRWYRTHGEQFHAKLASVRSGERLWVMLGSANFTRRNIGDYNLEANAVVDTSVTGPLARQVTAWFQALWSNADAGYSADADEWRDDRRLRYWQYRLMEGTGLSTF